MLVARFGRKMRQARIPFRLDQQTATLVAHGPFRYSLNLGYLSLAMVHAGAALLSNSLWTVCSCPRRRQSSGVARLVEREEPYPERSFDEAFLPYEASVPRWV